MRISFRSTHKLALAEVREMSDRSRHTSDGIIREENLARLPDIVQRYMRRSRVVDKLWIHTVRLQQTGQIRMAPGDPWMDLIAEQHYFTDPPGFVWDARVKKGPLFTFTGRDKLFEGTGDMLIKVACFNVLDAKGEKLDQGSMMRYLSEMIWFPAALLGPYIQWEAISENTARASLTCGNKVVSGTFIFNDDGDVIDFRGERYKDTSENANLLPWHTLTFAHREMEGFRIPVKGSAIWTLGDGDFTYIEVEITDIEYNPEIEE